eukprot:5206673-Prymnesium_polylepis.1
MDHFLARLARSEAATQQGGSENPKCFRYGARASGLTIPLYTAGTRLCLRDTQLGWRGCGFEANGSNECVYAARTSRLSGLCETGGTPCCEVRSHSTSRRLFSKLLGAPRRSDQPSACLKRKAAASRRVPNPNARVWYASARYAERPFVITRSAWPNASSTDVMTGDSMPEMVYMRAKHPTTSRVIKMGSFSTDTTNGTVAIRLIVRVQPVMTMCTATDGTVAASIKYAYAAASAVQKKASQFAGGVASMAFPTGIETTAYTRVASVEHVPAKACVDAPTGVSSS